MNKIEEEFDQLAHLLRLVSEVAKTIAFTTTYNHDLIAISREADQWAIRLDRRHPTLGGSEPTGGKR